jgi:AraC-like DNA-binding protein
MRISIGSHVSEINSKNSSPRCKAGLLGPLLRRLDAAGTHTNDLLAAHGLSRKLLANSCEALPLAQYVSLFEKSAAQLSERDLGLRMGSELQLRELGQAGEIFMTSGTLQRGVENISAAIESWQDATSMTLTNDAREAAWIYQLIEPDIWPRRQDAEFRISAMCTIIRQIWGNAWHPVEVYFEHAQPSDIKFHRRFFRCPIRFEQPGNAIVLRLCDMDTTAQTRDASLASAGDSGIAHLLERDTARRPIADQVRERVIRRLARETVSVCDIARELGYSQRSLQRYLSEAGTSVREIVREVRQQRADTLEENGCANRAAIAQALGYADSTALRRASRNWEAQETREPGKQPRKR